MSPGAIGRATNPRMTQLLPGRYRNRRKCWVCNERKASHAGIDALSGVALTSGCDHCMGMWVIDPDFVSLAAKAAPATPKNHVCPMCAKACTTGGHLSTHMKWCWEGTDHG